MVNRLIDHSKNAVFLSDIQHGFRSPGSTVDLLAVVSDRVA